MTRTLSLHTNAPPSWPRLELNPALLQDLQPAQRSLTLASAFAEATRGRPTPRVVAVDRVIVTPQGAVLVPLVVQDQGQEWRVHYFPEATQAAANRFAALREVLGPRTVYYAPGPLPEPRGPLPEVRERDRLFLVANPSPPTGTYAAWWRTPDQPHFTGTRTEALLTEIHRAAAGWEAEAFGLILTELGFLSCPEHFADIDSGFLRLPLTWLGGVDLIAEWTHQYGFRFLFPIRDGAAPLRDAFLQLFLLRLRAYRPDPPREGAYSYYLEQWELLTEELRNVPSPKALFALETGDNFWQD